MCKDEIDMKPWRVAEYVSAEQLLEEQPIAVIQIDAAIAQQKGRSPSSAGDTCISAGCTKDSMAGSVLCQEHYNHLPPRLRGE